MLLRETTDFPATHRNRVGSRSRNEDCCEAAQSSIDALSMPMLLPLFFEEAVLRSVRRLHDAMRRHGLFRTITFDSVPDDLFTTEYSQVAKGTSGKS